MEGKSQINCLYCGKSLFGMCQLQTRKFCSVTCSNKYIVNNSLIAWTSSIQSCHAGVIAI